MKKYFDRVQSQIIELNLECTPINQSQNKNLAHNVNNVLSSIFNKVL